MSDEELEDFFEKYAIGAYFTGGSQSRVEYKNNTKNLINIPHIRE